MIIRVLATVMIWSWVATIFDNLWPPYERNDWWCAVSIIFTAGFLTALAWWL